MTMPDERMRAIRFGFETLNEAVDDATLPPPLRECAQALLQRYPRAAQLEALLTHDGATLPSEWGEALNDARALFKELRRQPKATDAQLWSLTTTLRHYPDEGDIAHFMTVPTLPRWLEPEGKR